MEKVNTASKENKKKPSQLRNGSNFILKIQNSIMCFSFDLKPKTKGKKLQ